MGFLTESLRKETVLWPAPVGGRISLLFWEYGLQGDTKEEKRKNGPGPQSHTCEPGALVPHRTAGHLGATGWRQPKARSAGASARPPEEPSLQRACNMLPALHPQARPWAQVHTLSVGLWSTLLQAPEAAELLVRLPRQGSCGHYLVAFLHLQRKGHSQV